MRSCCPAAQLLCELTNLRHLAVAVSSHYASILPPGVPILVGLAEIPAAVAALRSLQTLWMPRHGGLRILPPELFTLTRCVDDSFFDEKI